MRITDIRILPFDTGDQYGRIRAFVEIELEGELRIAGIKIMESAAGGLFLTWPSVRSHSGGYRLVVIPAKELAREMRDQVIQAYHAAQKSNRT
ncbi:septation protein SpoVG family protein [bacterium]|nr:septation protein SpoVG family protein [candidate division CSSED10-310 bacterium]